MTKKGLYKELNKAFPRLSNDKLDLIFSTLGLLISRELGEGSSIIIPGIGKFTPEYRKAKKRYDVVRKTAVPEKDKVVVTFRADRMVKRGADYMLSKIRKIRQQGE